MLSLLVTDNVFRVGAFARTFIELQNALHFFEHIISQINITAFREYAHNNSCM